MSADQIANLGAYTQFERKVYEQQGSGLGLSIAKKLIEIHGGNFKVESTLNASTTVHFNPPK